MNEASASNLSHLKAHDEQLVRLGVLAERYFPEDPNTCLLKLRQLAELLAQMVASKVGLFTSPEEKQADLLRRLQDQGIVPREVGNLFHEVRRSGNDANHRLCGDHRTALLTLRLTWQLGVWFHSSPSPRARGRNAARTSPLPNGLQKPGQPTTRSSQVWFPSPSSKPSAGASTSQARFSKPSATAVASDRPPKWNCQPPTSVHKASSASPSCSPPTAAHRGSGLSDIKLFRLQPGKAVEVRGEAFELPMPPNAQDVSQKRHRGTSDLELSSQADLEAAKLLILMTYEGHATNPDAGQAVSNGPPPVGV